MMSGATTQGTIPDQNDYQGQADNYQSANLYNALDYMIRQINAGQVHAALVKVIFVHGGEPSPPVVDVQPMVSQLDGSGNQVPHGIVYGLPTYRLQGGMGAFMVDPIVGDIGLAVICDRDISNIKATKELGGPGSFRKNDYSDGCYFGAFLMGNPTNYVQITQDGINIVSTGTVNIFSEGLRHNDINIGFDHKHTNTQPGSGLSGPPQP